MKRILHTIILTGAVAATTLASLPQAEAGERWRHHDRRVLVQQNSNDALLAGVLGLAVGALAGAVVSHGNSSVHSKPVIAHRPSPERNYFPEAPAYYDDYGYYDRGYGRSGYRDVNAAAGAEPWTREWYRYCQNRYRSFDPQSGTYRGYDGRTHFCVAG